MPAFSLLLVAHWLETEINISLFFPYIIDLWKIMVHNFYKLKEREEINDPFLFYASSTWPRGFRWKSLSSVNGLVIIKLWC